MCLIISHTQAGRLMGVWSRLRLLGAARLTDTAARRVARVSLVAVAAVGAAYVVHQAGLSQRGALRIAVRSAGQICLVARAVARHCVVVNA